MKEKNPYNVLKVMPDAPVEVIRGAYLALLKNAAIHPDLGGSDQKAAEITNAYHTLLDPIKRDQARQQWNKATRSSHLPTYPQNNNNQLVKTIFFCFCVHCTKVNRVVGEKEFHEKPCVYCKKPLFPSEARKNSANHHALYKSGLYLLQKGLHHRAQLDLSKAVTLAPQQPTYHYWLARCYYASRVYEKAWVHFSLAHTLHRSQFAYLYWKGQSSFALKNYQRALKEFEHAQKMKPDSLVLYIRIGVCWFYIGNPAQAIKALKQALEHMPHKAELHALLGVVYFSNKQIKESRKAFELANEYGLQDQTINKYLGIVGASKFQSLNWLK